MNNHLKEVSLKNWANPSEAPVRVGSCMALPTIARNSGGKVCKGKSLQLIINIRKLKKKKVLNIGYRMWIYKVCNNLVL